MCGVVGLAVGMMGEATVAARGRVGSARRERWSPTEARCQSTANDTTRETMATKTTHHGMSVVNQEVNRSNQTSNREEKKVGVKRRRKRKRKRRRRRRRRKRAQRAMWVRVIERKEEVAHFVNTTNDNLLRHVGS